MPPPPTKKTNATHAYRSLAWNVLSRRKELHLTIEEAAWRAGIASRHWQRIEAGDVNATIHTLARVAAALDVEVFVLLRPLTPEGTQG